MGPEVVGHRREPTRGCSTGRLPLLAVATRQGGRHQRIPRVVIPCWCGVLPPHGVACGVHPHQAQTARQRCIQRQRHLFRRHFVRPTCACFLTGHHHRFVHVTVALVLRPRGRADKPMAVRALQHQTHQTHPTSAHLNTHHVECDDQPMPEGETGNTVAKRYNRGPGIEAALGRAPRLQRPAGHVLPLGRLTLGEALGLPITYCPNSAARSRRSQRGWRSSLPGCFSYMTVPIAISCCHPSPLEA